MRITFMGTGTSHGIPVVGCRCPVCTSTDPRNHRTRSSLLVSERGPSKPGKCVLFDTATEFRLQAVREGLNHLDALFYTHAHADHLHGLDDVRPLTRKKALPVYGSPETLEEIKEHYAYLFRKTQQGGGKPQVELHPLATEAKTIGPFTIQPIPLLHGELPVLGYRIGPLAYLTDCSALPAPSQSLLKGIRVLIIDGLRYRPHSTHFSLAEAEEVGRQLGAEKTYFTHLCHDVDHAALSAEYTRKYGKSPPFLPAWDGLSFDLDIESIYRI